MTESINETDMRLACNRAYESKLKAERPEATEEDKLEYQIHTAELNGAAASFAEDRIVQIKETSDKIYRIIQSLGRIPEFNLEWRLVDSAVHRLEHLVNQWRDDPSQFDMKMGLHVFALGGDAGEFSHNLTEKLTKEMGLES